MKFKIISQDVRARVGKVSTSRGIINTPAFMPVGTAGTVKAMLPENVREIGADIILANTYHLMLRPGAGSINALGGLHKFMNWQLPILTDSGGFQVMSLSKLSKVTERGVNFKSHIDGTEHLLTPERSIEIQRLLGSDIVMCFDECTRYPASEIEAEASMLMSMRWAKRSKNQFDKNPGEALFGIVQGGVYKHLRKQSVDMLAHIGFDGYSIGGLAVGEGHDTMVEVLDYVADLLPSNSVRYLMGVGKPPDIVEAVARGVDMFDCVLPSRSGRTGQAITRRGPINIRNSRHKDDERPLDSDCNCLTCRNYSRAYLNHVNRAQEIISSILLTWHNLYYYQELMGQLRNAIAKGNLVSFRTNFYDLWNGGDYEKL